MFVVVLLVYIHTGQLKNLPGDGGNRTDKFIELPDKYIAWNHLASRKTKYFLLMGHDPLISNCK